MTPQEMNRNLQKDIPVLRAEIHALYLKLDQKLGLSGASLPVTFGMDEDALGAYRPGTDEYEEHFHFSLLFTAFSSKHQLHKSDREDLYLHEYAHYMRRHFKVPAAYDFEPGVHGSAWRYCCSLVGAVPSPYYKAGESIKKQDYKKALTNRWKNIETSRKMDVYHREKEYQKEKDSKIYYKIGDCIKHPKYGAGVIQEITNTTGAVRLHVKFDEDIKIIDQAWLRKQQLK